MILSLSTAVGLWHEDSEIYDCDDTTLSYPWLLVERSLVCFISFKFLGQHREKFGSGSYHGS